MNYEKIYNQLISKAKLECRKKTTGLYYERHHIIPKCIGGNESKDNLVLLTAREHYVAHKLLCKLYPDDDKLHFSLWRMMNPQTKNHIRSYNISSMEYEYRRQLHQEKIRKIGLSNKGRQMTDEQKQKIRDKRKLQIITDETKKKISVATKGKPKPIRTEEHRKNLSKSMIGKNKGKLKPIRTEEHRKNLSLAHKNRNPIECPYCFISSTNKSNMNRYHFDNCKQK
jgi:hypothetical protein